MATQKQAKIYEPKIEMWLQAVKKVAGEKAYLNALGRARALGYLGAE